MMINICCYWYYILETTIWFRSRCSESNSESLYWHRKRPFSFYEVYADGKDYPCLIGYRKIKGILILTFNIKIIKSTYIYKEKKVVMQQNYSGWRFYKGAGMRYTTLFIVFIILLFVALLSMFIIHLRIVYGLSCVNSNNGWDGKGERFSSTWTGKKCPPRT